MDSEPRPTGQSFTIAVRNSRDTEVAVILEPQGREFSMPAGAVFEVRAEGPAGDSIEIDFGPDCITVWGWSGSVVGIYQNGVELGGPSLPVPPVPDGMTVRGFLRGVLDQPEP